MKIYIVMLVNDKGDLRIYHHRGHENREKARIEIENNLKYLGYGSEWSFVFDDWVG